MRSLPNILTLTRLVASPFIAWLIVEHRFPLALSVVLLAGLTDWFDGFTARKLGASGQLGVVLDPLADKVLLVTLFVVLAWVRLIPLWLFCLVLGRDLVIVAGALLLRRFRNIRRFLPSKLGKVSTFFQITLVLLVLLYASFPYVLVFWLKQTAVALATLFTALSGLDYVRIGIAMTRRRAAPASAA